MAQFPPKQPKKAAPVQPVEAVKNPVSIGRGGIKASLKVKAAGSQAAQGKEKTVNEF